MPNQPPDALKAADWVGRSRVSCSLLDPWPLEALSATIEGPAPSPENELPMLWHWLYFLETPRRSELGRDGHPRKGEFYPPVENPRRMFAGGRSRRHRGLVAGEPAELRETILRSEAKQGRSGAMTLLTVGYEYSQGGELCIAEERDFMYLPDRTGEMAVERTLEEQPVADAELSLDVPTDSVLLFKFSALTFNGHRIHYDADYARGLEGYPGVVVHAPLTALLLAELSRGPHGVPLKQFSFRATAPLYVGDRIRLRGERSGNTLSLKAYRPDGDVAMTAEAEQ